MSDENTLSVYANKAAKYADLVGDNLAADPLLAAFIADMPSGGHALDLGCGPGNAAHVMANAGLRVTATDAVAEMVALADQHAGVTAKVATFDEISGQDLYDGVWANFSLLHAARADMPRYLNALHRALKPNGQLHIGLKTGSGEKRDRIGRFYTYYTDSEISGLLETAGFTITSRTTGCDKGLDGTMADWIAVRAHG